MVTITFDDKDKKALETMTYVVEKKRIRFPQGADYSFERLDMILKQAKKLKLQKNHVQVGLILSFPFPKDKIKNQTVRFKGRAKGKRIINKKAISKFVGGERK